MRAYQPMEFFRIFGFNSDGRSTVKEASLPSLAEISELLTNQVCWIDHLDPDSNEVIGTISRE